MTFHRTYHYRHKTREAHSKPVNAKVSPEQVAEEIFFCGDPHGSFDHILQAAKEHRPKAMVILGDLQPPAPLHEVLADILSFVDVWWIPGNHDTDNDLFYDRLKNCRAWRRFPRADLDASAGSELYVGGRLHSSYRPRQYVERRFAEKTPHFYFPVNLR